VWILASCGYLLPRGGGIEGPSVRLAEICAAAYGNISVATRTIDIGAKSVRIQAVAKDFETNYQMSMEIERQIVTKHGVRFDDSLINTTIMAAQAIGFRNVVFKVVPKELVTHFHEEAKQIAMQDPDAMLATRKKALDFFEGMGVSSDRILKHFKVSAIKNLSHEDIVKLRGYFQALQDGDAELDEIFPPEKAESSDELESLMPDTWKPEIPDALDKSKITKAEKRSIIRSGIKSGKTAEEMLADIAVASAKKSSQSRTRRKPNTPSGEGSHQPDPDGASEPASASGTVTQDGSDQGNLV